MAFLKRIHCRNFLYLTASYTKKLKNIHYNLIVIVWIENEKHGIMFHVKHYIMFSIEHEVDVIFLSEKNV